MFRYLGEKIPMSDTDTDVYAVKFGLFLHSVCVFFPIDVTVIQDTVFVHLHAYINAKYIFQLHNVTTANDHANIRPIRTGIKRIDRVVHANDQT